MIVLCHASSPAKRAPGQPDQEELPKRTEELGVPRQRCGHHAQRKAICSATIRAGPGYLEVPFFATQETRRRKAMAGACAVRLPDSHVPLLSI